MLVPLLIAFQSLVAGETCPAAVDVEARVRTILHLPPEQELSEGFVVERHEAGLYVELRSADAAVIGQRTLPAEGSCDELAQAAAVVLSAWLSDVHPDFAGALPPAPAPAPEPLPEPAPEPPVPPAPKTAVAPPPPVFSPLPPARRVELGLAVGTDLAVAPASLAATGIAVVDYAPPARGWGLSAFAATTWPRQARLGPGSVSWRRWPVGVGPSLRLSGGGLRWDASAGIALGWLHFAASNLDRVSSQDGFDWGAFLHFRASSRGRAGAFVQADARFFPGDTGASATYPGGRWLAPVPGFSLGLVAGAWLAP